MNLSRKRYHEVKKYIRKKRRRAKRKPMALLIIFILFGAFFIGGILNSKNLVVSTYNISYETLPEAFDGFRIAQLSDLHGRSFSNDQGELIDLVRDQQPDIIVLTGDLLDAHDTELTPCTVLCKGLMAIAPVYWIKGNHFHKMKDPTLAKTLHDKLIAMGVVALDDDVTEIKLEDDSIYICGLDDPQRLYPLNKMTAEYAKKVVRSQVISQLDKVENRMSEDNFRILLTHRPGNADLASERGYALVLAGHTHGGQLCLPGGIEVIGEYTEFFPELKSGYNDINGMPLIITSGLGYSNLKLRLYNPPEIVVTNLKYIK